MTKLPALLLAAACLAVGAPAVAAGDADAAPAPTERAPKVKEKKLCQSVTEVGSRFSKKVCRTESEWRAEREGQQRALNDSKRED